MAASLAPLLSLQVRAIESSSIEQRLAKLEKAANRDQNGDAQLTDLAAADDEPFHG